jgi:hypothetical protein
VLQLLRTRDKWTIFNAKKQLWTGPDGKPDPKKKYAKLAIHEDMSVEQRKANADLRGKLQSIRKDDQAVTGLIRGPILTTKKDGSILHKYKWTPTNIETLQ